MACLQWSARLVGAPSLAPITNIMSVFERDQLIEYYSLNNLKNYFTLF